MPRKPEDTNIIRFTRLIGELMIQVRAHYNVESDEWRLVSRLNGRIIERRASRDVWMEAKDMVDCALDEGASHA